MESHRSGFEFETIEMFHKRMKHFMKKISIKNPLNSWINQTNLNVYLGGILTMQRLCL